MIPGSKKDFIGAWFMRLLLVLVSGAIFWTCKLILAGVMYLVNTIPVMQTSLNALPAMKQAVDQLQIDVQSIKKNAVTETQMNDAIGAAEQRVSEKFTKELKRQTRPVANQPNH